MDDIKFNSAQELYARVLPALKSKKKELVKNKIKYISEKDIWNLLSNNTWKREQDLTLADIVDDILNISNIRLVEMYHELHKEKEEVVELPKETKVPPKKSEEEIELPKLKNKE